MRVRKKAWTEKELETNPYMIQDPGQWRGRWQEYFQNDKPLFVEIGCGKGQFLAQTAAENPQNNFIGVERQSTVIAVAARKLGRSLENVGLIRGEVEDLKEYFAPGEIKRLYINFCDPWPKKKQAKRRLTHHHFLEEYKELFEQSGEIFFKTDNQGLFEFSLNEFSQNGWVMSQISLDLHKSQWEGNVMTEYEQKFSEMGMPIYRLEARWAKNGLIHETEKEHEKAQ